MVEIAFNEEGQPINCLELLEMTVALVWNVWYPMCLFLFPEIHGVLLPKGFFNCWRPIRSSHKSWNKATLKSYFQWLIASCKMLSETSETYNRGSSSRTIKSFKLREKQFSVSGKFVRYQQNLIDKMIWQHHLPEDDCSIFRAGVCLISIFHCYLCPNFRWSCQKSSFLHLVKEKLPFHMP